MAQVPALQLRLRALRQRAGRSQSDIARALGVTRTHVSKVEAGKSGVTLELLDRYVSEIGCRLVIEGEPVAAGDALTDDRGRLLLDLRRVLPYLPLLLITEMALMVRSWTERYVP